MDDVKDLAINAGGNKVVYAKSNIESATVTNVGAGSTFTGFTGTDISVTTAALAADETLTINSKVYTSGKAGNVITVEKGNVIDGVLRVGASYSFDTYYQNASTKETITSTVTSAASTSVDVNVVGGQVQSITGLDAQNEKVTVTTEIVEKDGTTTEVESVYTVTSTAEEIAAKKFVIQKKETVNGVTTTYTQTFTTATQNVTTTSGWAVSDVQNKSTFDWTNTGYFEADLVDGKYLSGTWSGEPPVFTPAPIAQQLAEVTTVPGKKYIVVESKKNLDGSFTVSSITLMEAQPTGALAKVAGTIGAINVTAPAGANLTLPADHDGTFTVAGTKGLSYVVAPQDTVTCTFAGVDETIAVGGVTYTTAGAYADAMIMGDGTVTQGQFKVKGTMSGSAVPDKNNPTAVKTVTYTAGTGDSAATDGVTVTFTNTSTGGEIENVTGLGKGEKVVFDHVQYTEKSGVKSYQTTTVVSDGTKTTKTIKNADFPVDLVMTANTTENLDVIKEEGFRWANKFDFGASTDGVMGIFAANATGSGAAVAITAQTDETIPAAFAAGDDDRRYIIVGGSKKNGVYTINHLQAMVYSNTNKELELVPSITVGAVTITAPTDGNLTLAADAYKSDGSEADKERRYGITVKGTAGRTYTGFESGDTVTATLETGDTVTVGSSEYKAALGGTVSIDGAGVAMKGSFLADSAKHTVTAAADAFSGGTKVVQWTKGDGVRVTVSGSEITHIIGLAAGEEIKVTTTTAAGAKTVETYSAAKGTDGVLVTKTVVADGSTTKYTKTLADDTKDILDPDDWTAGGDVVTKSKFDWKPSGGAGWFAVDVDETKKTVGAVTVEPQPKEISITKANAGKYYLKVTPDDEGQLTTAKSIGIYKVASNGTLEEVTGLTGLTGTIAITAPTAKALHYEAATSAAVAATGLKVKITGAIKGSVVALATGDTLTTAQLAKGDTVSAGANVYTAGAVGALSFTRDAVSEAVFSGTLALASDTTIQASGAAGADVGDNMSIQVSDGGSDKAVVTIANGILSKVESLTGTLTTAQDGVQVVYKDDGTPAAVTGMAAGKSITLAKMTEGDSFTAGGATYYSGKKDNVVTLVQEVSTVMVQDGAIGIVPGENTKTFYTTNTSNADDNYKIEFTRGSSSTSTPILTIENGKVVAIEGLGAGTAGDKLVITEKPKTGDSTVTTYQLDATGTKVTKTVQVGTAEATTSTAFIAKGSDLLKASFINGATEGGETLEDNPIVGQFSWNDISGRATGYFAIGEAAKNSTNVVEQPSAIELKKSSVDKRYVVATVSNGTALNGAEGRVLALGVLKVTKAGVPTTEGVSLTAADTIKIAAPTTPVIYEKAAADAHHVEFTKVAKNSVFTGLAAADKVTTDSLAIGNRISLDGSTFVAGAKGQLIFIGQTTGDPAVNNTALLTGTIRLQNNEIAVLAGDAKTTVSTDDVTVTVGNTGTPDNVIVKVLNGKVSSITGVATIGTTVSVAYGGKTYTYEALDSNAKGSTMFRLTTDGGASYTYRSVSAGASFYSEDGAAYKVLANTKVTALNWTGAGAVNTYVALADDLMTPATISKGSADLKTADFQSLPNKYYLNLKGNTALKNGIETLTITGLAMMQADGSGTVKATKTGFGSTLNIDTALGDGKYAALVYKLPTGTARTTFANIAGTVGLGSELTNLANVDKIDTANGTFTFGTNGKSFKIYKSATGRTEETKVEYAGADKPVATVSGQTVTSVTGMTAGKLTITKNDEDAGLVTTVYEWKTVNKVKSLYRTITAADGTVTVDTMTAAGAEGDIISATYTTNDPTAINSVFDWTLDKSATGYFKATATAAAVKALTTNIKDTRKDTNTYVKVSLDETSKRAAVVDTAGAVTAVKFNATTGAEEASTFSGKLTITAPKTALTFDRATAFDATMAGATVAITGAATGSDITGLAKNDTVTTASLTATGWIKLGGLFFSAGKAGAMEFTVQEINTDDLHYTLTKGTAALVSGGTTEGGNLLYAGTTLITAENKAVLETSTITVTAATNAKGTTFTIGGISENERFTIKNPAWTQVDGNGVTFTRSGSSLFCTYYSEAESQTVTKVYAKLGTAADATITSAILEKAFYDTAKTPTWSTLTKTIDDSTGVEKTDYVFNTIDLAKMEQRITSEKNKNKKNIMSEEADYVTYAFVIDKYLSAGTKAGTKLTPAIVGNAADPEWQVTLGTMTNAGADVYWTGRRTYTATTHGDIGQNIKAAVNWNVIGTAANDTITGASGNGSATISGGAGNDTITGGSANEIFRFNMGTGDKDVLKSYTSYANNKGDKLTVTGFDLSNVYLAGTGLDTNQKTKLTGVLLHDGTYKENTGAYTNGMLLVGVAGKAVTIDDGVNGEKVYYFGDGTKTKGAATFTYQSGAYYLANSKLTNTLKVTTDKNKATKTTLGDTVEIDLNAEGAMGSYYTNINALDASASANRMILTAGAKGSTVKGGSYQTTLRGGSGNDVLQGGSGEDVFSFKEGLAGADTIKSYVSAKDAVYVGALGDGQGINVNGIDIYSQGANVLLKQGNDTVTIEGAAGATKALRFSKDGSSTNTLSYYVAASTAKANTFTATVDKDVEVKTVGDTTTVTMKSYYVGTESATDTLKISGKGLGTSNETTGYAEFDLKDANLSSLEILDTSGVTGTKNLLSYITLKGKTEGTFTLKGSTNAYVKEKFDLTDLNAAGTAGTATIQNLGVGDVIEIAAGAKASIVKNVATLTWDNGSTITLKGIKDFTTAFGTNATAIAAGGKFTRQK